MTGSTIGGFFPLEEPSRGGPLPPPDAMLYRSARAALRAVLEHTMPRRFVAPYYVCEAALAPAAALGIPLVQYPIGSDLAPRLPDIESRDAVLLVDYFGLCGQQLEEVPVPRERLIFDQTHALFRTSPAGSWRFTSARKWFGVPDGAFLFGPERLLQPAPAPLQSAPTHLIERRWGAPDAAYRAYLQAEAGFDAVIGPISTTSVALLGGVDVDFVRGVRRANFAALDAVLAPLNELRFSPTAVDVPFCYPFLPKGVVSKQALAEVGIFVPTFWADCLKSEDARFEWERDLARRLLPLPIDQRYGPVDLGRMADAVLALCQRA